MSERATTILTSFNGGEASPRMAGRPDLRRYFTSHKRMLGFIPMVQGPALAAPGTHMVEKAKGPCRLIAFEPYVTQGYALELSDSAMRFYTNNARVADPESPSDPLEIATPWTLDQVRQLDYCGSIDVCYFTGGGVQQQELRRTAADAFSIAPLDLDHGPIGQANTDETATILVSGSTTVGSSVTLTCANPIFVATDIGRLIEIEAEDYSGLASWQVGNKSAYGDRRYWGTRVYLNVSAGTNLMGNNPPIHDHGVVVDGSQSEDASGDNSWGVAWQFLYGRFGMVKITGFTDAYEVTATVIDALAESLTTTASWRWAFGAFSDTTGWPDSVCLWGESLVLFHNATSTGYVSVQYDLTNFRRRDSSGDFQHDLAGSFTLPNRDAVSWMEADGVLLLGGAKGIYPVERILTNTGEAGPPQFKIDKPARSGSASTKPASADERLLFVQKAGRKVLELDYTLQRDRYEATDTTRFADHIGRPGFVDLAWQQEPERLAWAARGDGTLASLTYSPDEDVTGWAVRQLAEGLAATSLCRITDPDGKRDQLWISADIGEETWILRMAKLWETGDDPETQHYVDAALIYDGDPVLHFSGLDHLNGRTVDVLADGVPITGLTVTGNAVTLARPASHVIIGLPYPARIITLPIEYGAPEGTAQGKTARIVSVTLRVAETQGLRVCVLDPEAPGFDLDADDVWLEIETRLPGDPMDQAVPLFTGDLDADVVGCFDKGGVLSIERVQPTNAVLLAIIPQIEVAE